ncbi:MAG: CRTAC1 family protein, partial [Planctomycetes bacterium]|nr:CRTAC1 family protein [Planctomycetota bacterium]
LQEIGQISGTNVNDRGFPDGSMGVQVFDYNLDGLPDLWITDFEEEYPALFRNLGNGLFRHVSRATGVAALGGMYVGWGTVAADFDHDGDEDLFVANGHVLRHPRKASVQQRALVIENLGGERFINATSAAGAALQVERLGRGLVSADFDMDGDVDVALSSINEPVAILANETVADGNWLSIRLVGRASNRDAVGAVLTLETPAANQVRQIVGGGSYASTCDRTVHFGWSGSPEPVRLEVRWPSGRIQKYDQLSSRRRHLLIEAE